MENNPDGPHPEWVYDDTGDARLILLRKGEFYRYVICSKMASKISTLWKDKLDPARAPVDRDRKRQIKIQDDDPTAVSIFLNIAHHKLNDVSFTMSPDTLAGVARFTHKYESAELIRPWIGHWFASAKGIHESLAPSWGMIYVAWVFGDVDMFQELTDGLARVVTVDERGCAMTPDGTRLQDIPLPEHLYDKIVNSRKAVIDSVVSACRSHFSIFENHWEDDMRLCIAGDGKHGHCDTLSYGSLVREFRRNSLGILVDKQCRNRSQSLCMNVETLLQRVGSIQLSNGCEIDPEAHESCNETSSLMRRLKEIKMPSPVGEEDRVHMEQQQELYPIKRID